jgi:hypothetical protein
VGNEEKEIHPSPPFEGRSDILIYVIVVKVFVIVNVSVIVIIVLFINA